MMSGDSRLGALAEASALVIVRVPTGEGRHWLLHFPGNLVGGRSVKIRRARLLALLRRGRARGGVFEPGPSPALVLDIDARVLLVDGHTTPTRTVRYTRSAHRPAENNNAADEIWREQGARSDWSGISDSLDKSSTIVVLIGGIGAGIGTFF